MNLKNIYLVVSAIFWHIQTAVIHTLGGAFLVGLQNFLVHLHFPLFQSHHSCLTPSPFEASHFLAPPFALQV